MATNTEDRLNRFVDHVALKVNEGGEVETVFFNRRIPDGYAPIRGNEEVSERVRSYILLGMLSRRRQGTIEKNIPYLSTPLVEEGERMMKEVVRSIVHDKIFIKSVANAVSERLQHEHRPEVS